jgi:hypothetical protein
LLIYLDGGTLKRRIGSTTVDLGQWAPSAPTLYYLGTPGNLTGSYYWFITFVRTVEGYSDESGPSTVTGPIDIANGQMLIAAPAITDPAITAWKIYRLSSNTGVYQFIAELDVLVTSYTDNWHDADLAVLGPGPTTYYTSPQGNQITWAKPPLGLQGITTQLHCGMFFAWKDSTLYWCDPGNPDAWPDIYSMNFQTNIKNVIPFAGSVAVLCEGGPKRVDGTNPELLQPSDPLGKEPCLSISACSSNSGAVYLSDTGVVLFNLMDTVVMSSGNFNQEWLTENIVPTSAQFAISHNFAYLFYDDFALCYDQNSKQWFHFTVNAEAVFVNPEDGDVYFLDSGSVKKLCGSTELVATCTWESGKIKTEDPEEDKLWYRIRPNGTGTMTFELVVDDLSMGTKVIDLDSKMERDLHFKFPENTKGKALKLKVTGNGSVKEIMVEYETG